MGNQGDSSCGALLHADGTGRRAVPLEQNAAFTETHSNGANALSRLKRGWHPSRDARVTCAAQEVPGFCPEVRAYAVVSREQQLSARAAPLECLAAIRARIAEKGRQRG